MFCHTGGFVCLGKRKKNGLAKGGSYYFLGQSQSESSNIQGLKNSKLEIESTSVVKFQN